MSEASEIQIFMLFSILWGVVGFNDNRLPVHTRLLNTMLERAEQIGNYSIPAVKVNQPLVVKFGLRVIRIEADCKHSQLTVTAWCRMTWFNDFMKWNKTNYGGIDRIFMPTEKLWTPDIMLANSGKQMERDIARGMLQMRYTGYVFGAFHQVFQVPCLFSLQDYPWDEYTCHMWFQSSGYTSNVLSIEPYSYKQSSSFDLDTYLGGFREMDEWEIVKNETTLVKVPRDEGAILMFSRRRSIRMTLVLRRRLSFMTLLLTVPSIIFSFMTCLIFLVPPTRPDRLAYGNSLFSSYLVFMLILTASMPPTSGAFPKLGLFYGFNILMIVASVAISVVVIHVSRKGSFGERLPQCFNKVALQRMGAYLFVSEGRRSSLPPSSSPNNRGHSSACKPLRSCSDQDPSPDLQCNQHNKYSGFAESELLSRQPKVVGFNFEDIQIGPKVQRVSQDLNHTNTSLEEIHVDKNADHKKEEDLIFLNTEEHWKMLAKILDRFFFFIFCIIAAVGLGVLFPWPRS